MTPFAISARYKWMIFLPLLLFYLGYIHKNIPEEFRGDEPRYVRYAVNLTQGFYTDSDKPEFLCGPGYPLLLAPFVALSEDLLWARLFNGFLLFGAVIFFYLTAQLYMDEKKAIIISFILGLYPFTYRWSSFLYAESLSIFLHCGFFYFLALSVRAKEYSIQNILFAALFLGFTMLNKVIFAYVVMALLGLVIVGRLILREKQLEKVGLICIVAYIVCLPYLVYTYNLTGKVFYWSTSGGSQLYWRASPHPGEFGDWVAPQLVFHPETAGEDRCNINQVAQNHREFFQGLPFAGEDSATTLPAGDDMFKKSAIDNIKKHPTKYGRNTVASFFRLFFDYPLSYTPQKMATLTYIVPNMFLLVLSALLIYPIWIARKIIPWEMWTLMCYLLIFIGGMSLLNGRIRHLVPNIPTFILLLGYFITNIVRIDIVSQKTQNKHTN